jgi:hypothetical protein
VSQGHVKASGTNGRTFRVGDYFGWSVGSPAKIRPLMNHEEVFLGLIPAEVSRRLRLSRAALDRQPFPNLDGFRGGTGVREDLCGGIQPGACGQGGCCLGQ